MVTYMSYLYVCLYFSRLTLHGNVLYSVGVFTLDEFQCTVMLFTLLWIGHAGRLESECVSRCNACLPVCMAGAVTQEVSHPPLPNLLIGSVDTPKEHTAKLFHVMFQAVSAFDVLFGLTTNLTFPPQWTALSDSIPTPCMYSISNITWLAHSVPLYYFI